MKIEKGIKPEAVKVVLYGVEGIGKSTFGASCPRPLVLDVEGSTGMLNVDRVDARGMDWKEFLSTLKEFAANPGDYSTIVIDTMDWLERKCHEYTAKAEGKVSIDDFGFGAGYKKAAANMAEMLGILDTIAAKGVHVLCLAHSTRVKFELPEEMGAYDKYELKLQKQAAALVKEWATDLLFANYKTVIAHTSDSTNIAKGSNKAMGSKRMLYAEHSAVFDAKNRHGLKAEMPFEFKSVADLFKPVNAPAPAKPEPQPVEAQAEKIAAVEADIIPDALKALMERDGISADVVRDFLQSRGHLAPGGLIKDLDAKKVKSLTGKSWAKVVEFNAALSDELPF